MRCDKKLDSIGSIAGVGIANKLTGVERAKADHVDARVEYMGMKNGKLRKCCLHQLLLFEQ